MPTKPRFTVSALIERDYPIFSKLVKYVRVVKYVHVKVTGACYRSCREMPALLQTTELWKLFCGLCAGDMKYFFGT